RCFSRKNRSAPPPTQSPPSPISFAGSSTAVSNKTSTSRPPRSRPVSSAPPTPERRSTEPPKFSPPRSVRCEEGKNQEPAASIVNPLTPMLPPLGVTPGTFEKPQLALDVPVALGDTVK